VATDFRLSKFSARNVPIRPRQPFMDYVRADFATNLEARRLFWAFGYMLEKNLPDDQLLWLYYGHYMPWAWQHIISRHLWDESRHGDSGYSRLRDFGISLEDVGFSGYDQAGARRRVEGAGRPAGPHARRGLCPPAGAPRPVQGRAAHQGADSTRTCS
jgi:hypothetical protein